MTTPEERLLDDEREREADAYLRGEESLDRGAVRASPGFIEAHGLYREPGDDTFQIAAASIETTYADHHMGDKTITGTQVLTMSGQTYSLLAPLRCVRWAIAKAKELDR